MTESYQPVACEFHSELENLAMHQAKVKLTVQSENLDVSNLSCQVMDVITASGAEYLVLLDPDKKQFRVRLDEIADIRHEAG